VERGKPSSKTDRFARRGTWIAEASRCLIGFNVRVDLMAHVHRASVYSKLLSMIIPSRSCLDDSRNDRT